MTISLPAFLAAQHEAALDPLAKGATAWKGCSPAGVADAGLELDALPTPLMALNRTAVAHNVATMAAWCARMQVRLAPHGKTTMAPELWRRQLDAGAWGITVANEPQLDTAVRIGVPRVMLANPLLRRSAAHSLRAALAEGVVQEALVWVDSIDAVRMLEGAADEAAIGVLIDVGARGGRTGVRTMTEVRRLAERIGHAPGLVLRGVAGYEGAIADARTDPRGVDAYLLSVCDAVDAVRDLIDGPIPILSIGGSAGVARTAGVVRGRLAPESTDVVLRSGAYIAHDDGFYREREEPDLPLRAAVSVWGRVLSVPEEGLALVDVGRRDVSYDQGLPRFLGLHRAGRRMEGVSAEVAALNDQHAFLSFVPSQPSPRFGDLVEFGVSHPCTTFDRWPVVLEVESRGDSRATVVGAFRTHF